MHSARRPPAAYIAGLWSRRPPDIRRVWLLVGSGARDLVHSLSLSRLCSLPKHHAAKKYEKNRVLVFSSCLETVRWSSLPSRFWQSSASLRIWFAFGSYSPSFRLLSPSPLRLLFALHDRVMEARSLLTQQLLSARV